MKREIGFSARNNGFWLNFPNGVILSTQFNFGSYCEGHERFLEEMRKDSNFFSKSRGVVLNAEIAVGIEGNKLKLTKEMNKKVFGLKVENIKGWVSFEDWLKVVDWCKKYERK